MLPEKLVRSGTECYYHDTSADEWHRVRITDGHSHVIFEWVNPQDSGGPILPQGPKELAVTIKYLDSDRTEDAITRELFPLEGDQKLFHCIETVDKGPNDKPGVFVIAANIGIAWAIAEAEANAAKKALLRLFPLSWKRQQDDRSGWFFQFAE